MKKYFALLLSFMFILSLSACTKIPDTKTPTEADSDNEPVGVINPITELSEDEFINEYGAYWLPEGSENMRFSQINTSDDDIKLAQIDFTRFEKEYCFRFLKGEEEDISGMYYEPWDYDNKTDSSKTGNPTCHIRITKDGETDVGACTWYDEKSGTNYSITMSENASRDLLISTFDSIYAYYCATIS